MRVLQALSLAVVALLVAAAGPGGKRGHAAPAPTQWTKVVARTPEGGWRMGNPTAPAKLIEYGSRSCPVCHRFYLDGDEALRARVATGKVSWEFRDFPIHPQDIGNSLLGRCVPVATYFTILDRMYADQPTFNAKAASLDLDTFGRLQQMSRLQAARAWADTLGYTELVKRGGMTDARLAQCFTDAQLKSLGDGMKMAVDKYGVGGTPTFLLNGKRLDNVVSWAQLEPLLRSSGG